MIHRSVTGKTTGESLFSCAKTLYGTAFVHVNDSIYHNDPMARAFKDFYAKNPIDVWTWLLVTKLGHSGLPRSRGSFPKDSSYPYFQNMGALFVEGLPQRLTSAFNLVNLYPLNELFKKNPFLSRMVLRYLLYKKKARKLIFC